MTSKENLTIWNHPRPIVRLLTAIAFVTTGIFHFLRADLLVRIVPPIFPNPLLLVRVSGMCEIAGALGLLVPALRRAAAWGLVALLIAVFPANVYMAVHPHQFADLKLPPWALRARLPLQAVFIALMLWLREE
jgi:uncharacterized membrane protein